MSHRVREERELADVAKPAPPAPRVPDLLSLQRSAGNQAVTRMIQRLVAVERPHKVLHAPDTVNLESDRTKSSLKSLLGASPTVKKHSVEHFRKYVAFPKAKWTMDPSAWAAENLGTGRNQEQHSPPPAYQNNVDPTIDQQVTAQFADPMKVFRYGDNDAIQYGVEESDPLLLLQPRDMGEKPDALPERAHGPSACVVQALESIGHEVPEDGGTSTDEWHAFCRAQKPELDYRTDNQIARLYVEILGFTLVNNVATPWQNLNWQALGGDGTYLVSSFDRAPSGGKIGHMIAVEVASNAVTTVHDQQNLTKPYFAKPQHTVHAQYIYRV